MDDAKVQIFQVINEALHLDGVGDFEKAYVKYIQSVLAISKYLMNQYSSTGFPYVVENYQSMQKILIVGRQCWERLDNLLQNIGPKTEKTKQDDVRPSDGSSISSFTTESPLDKSNDSLSGELSLKSGKFTMHMSNNSSKTEVQTIFAQRPQVTPLEKCRLENTKLRKTYQSRILHAKSPVIKANLSLEFHRKIAENISIAKTKERELLIEQQQKEKKAMQQATKILSQSMQIRLTGLENEKCQLYANILQYEESERWTKNFRIRLASHPTDQALIEEVTKTTLKRVDHPLTRWLLWKQNSIREECTYVVESHRQHHLSKEQASLINGEAEQESEMNNQQKLNGQGVTESVIQSKSISHRTDNYNNLKNYLEETMNNTCNICDTCMLMLGLMYEKLNESEIAQDICHRVVEDIVLGPIWQYLISLFRCYNNQSEYKIAQAMKEFANCLPKDFGLKVVTDDKYFSYDKCACKLKGILSITSPVHKLQSLVQAVQKFCDLQRTGDDGTPLTPILLGADDLIPMLSYILVQTGVPCLLSECQALEQLLDQRYLLGEEGYCLTSFQMAFQYLETQADKLDLN